MLLYTLAVLAFGIEAIAFSISKDATAQDLNHQYRCVGAVILVTDNDRMSDVNILTGYGAEKQVAIGNYYRKRYFGRDANSKVSSPFVIEGLDSNYAPKQVYAQTPNSSLLQNSLTSFLQGLYPSSSNNASLQNTGGSVSSNSSAGALNGYQYLPIDIQSETSNDYFFLEGGVECPARNKAKLERSSDYKSAYNKNKKFYKSLKHLLPLNYPDSELNFNYAWSIYNYLLTNSIHNSTMASKINSATLKKAKDLAGQMNWLQSYRWSHKAKRDTIAGEAILGSVYNHLNATKTTGSPYLNVLSIPFSGIQEFASLLRVDRKSSVFKQIPSYGSTYVLELLKDSGGGYSVMFSYKGGSDSSLKSFPMFKKEYTVMAWSSFETAINKVALKNLRAWCQECKSTSTRCKRYSDAYIYGEQLQQKGYNLKKLASDTTSHRIRTRRFSDGKAGGIGAAIGIGIVLLVEGFIYMCNIIGVHADRSNLKGTAVQDASNWEVGGYLILRNLITLPTLFLGGDDGDSGGDCGGCDVGGGGDIGGADCGGDGGGN